MAKPDALVSSSEGVSDTIYFYLGMNPISDEKCAEELQLQDALVSSITSLSPSQDEDTLTASSSSSSNQPLISKSLVIGSHKETAKPDALLSSSEGVSDTVFGMNPISDAEELQLQDALVSRVTLLSPSRDENTLTASPSSNQPLISKSLVIGSHKEMVKPDALVSSSEGVSGTIFFYLGMNPISDEKCAEELQLQDALVSSFTSRDENTLTASSSSSKQPLMEASKSPDSFCEICMDTKAVSEMFQNSNVCGHRFCSDCIRGHVAAKIKENQTVVKCPEPDCKGMIGPEVCESILPKEVLERWDNILCVSLIMESDKFYCPFEDCSAMMVADGGVAVTSSECQNCHRLFCAQCKVAWHCGKDCSEFQKGDGKLDDELFINLAKDNKWMKCPECKFFVEKLDGCLHIACRCGNDFCYRCGEHYTKNHTCQE